MGKFLEWWFVDNPEDDFRMRMRKGILGVLSGPFALLHVVYSIRGFLVYETTTARLGLIGIVMIAIIYIISSTWMRVTKTVSDKLITASLWAIASTGTISILSFPEFDMKTAVFSIQSVGVMAGMPKTSLRLYLLMTISQLIVIDWNSGSRQYPDKLLSFPDPLIHTAQLSQVVAFWACTIVMMGILNMFYGQVQESERRGAAQTAANDMTFRVLMRHRKYDTEEVSKILTQCSQEKLVDPRLIQLFEDMNGNLQRYRPFLPNYLFNDDDTTSGDDVEGGKHHDHEEDGDQSEGAIIIDDESRSVRSRSDRSLRAGPPSTNYKDSNSEMSWQSNNAAALASGAALANTTSPIGLSKRAAHYVGRITFALLDLCAQRMHFDASTDRPDAQGSEVFQAVVDSIYTLARETKASVHSMLGDTVQLSWNATSSVPLPETKGAVFLSRFTKQFATTSPDSLPLTISAAVCSGLASVYSITSHQQQALIVEAPWMPALEGIFNLSKQHAETSRGKLQKLLRTSGEGGQHYRIDKNRGGVVLMDEATQQASRMEVDSYPVEQVSYVPTAKTPSKYKRHPATRVTPVNSPQPDQLKGGIATPSAAPDSDDESVGVAKKYSFLAHSPLNDLTSSSSLRAAPAGELNVLVYQILGEKVRADDEWMYQLQHENDEAKSSDRSKAAALQLAAIVALADGRCGEAAAALESVADHQASAMLANTPTQDNEDMQLLKGKMKKKKLEGQQGGSGVPCGSSLFTEALARRCQRNLTTFPEQHK